VAKVALAARRRQPSRQADELQTIPGVGPSIAVDLRELGIRRVADLRGRDPERMYRRLIALRGEHQDRCLLYVFRCAVYFASTPRPRRELLDWWRWKDQR
jgi:hypothetical protein